MIIVLATHGLWLVEVPETSPFTAKERATIFQAPSTWPEKDVCSHEAIAQSIRLLRLPAVAPGRPDPQPRFPFVRLQTES